MSVAETETEMVQRHVRQGEACVNHQREVVESFRARGFDSSVAERLLETFEELQDAHLAHLQRLSPRSKPIKTG